MLWHRDFRLLWLGQTVSQLGSHVTVVALPLVAITVLDATTFQVGLLTTATYAGFLLIGLPAGAWVDRTRRRPVLVGADVARCLLLASIPLAAVPGVLTLAQLYSVALLHSLCTVFFDVSYQSYLPALVGRAKLVEGNAKLEASRAASGAAGPALGGFLVQLFSAPFALLADAVSYLASLTALIAIRTREPIPARSHGSRFHEEIIEGLRFVFGHRILRVVTGTTATFNLFNGALQALVVVFLVRTVGVEAGTVGVLLSTQALGGVIGGTLSTRFARWLGSARALIAAAGIGGGVAFLVPLTGPGVLLVFFVVSGLLFGIGGVVYNVIQVSYRQAMCPPRLLGRMNASVRFVVWGTIPLGGLVGGGLGEVLGNRGGLWVVAASLTLAPIWLLASPIRRMRELHDPGSAPA